MCRVIFLFKNWFYCFVFFFFLMIRRPPRSTQSRSSAASDVYKRQNQGIPESQVLPPKYWSNKVFTPVKQETHTLPGLDKLDLPPVPDSPDAPPSQEQTKPCLLYTSPSPRDRTRSRMPSSAWKKKTKLTNLISQLKYPTTPSIYNTPLTYHPNPLLIS